MNPSIQSTQAAGNLKVSEMSSPEKLEKEVPDEATTEVPLVDINESATFLHR